MSADESLTYVFIPPLVAVLLHAENENNEPLNEEQVFQILNEATCVALPESVALEMEESRGYVDISPDNVWIEWQKFRLLNLNE